LIQRKLKIKFHLVVKVFNGTEDSVDLEIDGKLLVTTNDLTEAGHGGLTRIHLVLAQSPQRVG
jgi:hypothetical protein